MQRAPNRLFSGRCNFDIISENRLGKIYNSALNFMAGVNKQLEPLASDLNLSYLHQENL